MDLQLEFKEKNLIVRVGGELDLVVAQEFRSKVEQAMEEYPVKNILLNLAKVNFIDSSGLGVILGRYKKIVLLEGKMVLVEVQPQVKKIFELSGLFKIMEQYDSETDAMNQLLTA